jgi:hypothetical protein
VETASATTRRHACSRLARSSAKGGSTWGQGWWRGRGRGVGQVTRRTSGWAAVCGCVTERAGHADGRPGRGALARAPARPQRRKQGACAETRARALAPAGAPPAKAACLQAHQQVRQLGVAAVGLLDAVEELGTDDAATLGGGVEKGPGRRPVARAVAVELSAGFVPRGPGPGPGGARAGVSAAPILCRRDPAGAPQLGRGSPAECARPRGPGGGDLTFQMRARPPRSTFQDFSSDLALMMFMP